MIPQGGVLGSIGSQQAQQQTSRTYHIDLVTNRIVGMIDGLEAVKQAVFHILATERFEHLIYSGNHGSELADLPGKEQALVRAELSRRIRSALLQDDRIIDIQDMQINLTGDEAFAQFTVVSQYGSFQASKGVMTNV
jgi:hypothetical protein